MPSWLLNITGIRHERHLFQDNVIVRLKFVSAVCPHRQLRRQLTMAQSCTKPFPGIVSVRSNVFLPFLSSTQTVHFVSDVSVCVLSGDTTDARENGNLEQWHMHKIDAYGDEAFIRTQTFKQINGLCVRGRLLRLLTNNAHMAVLLEARSRVYLVAHRVT